MDAVGQRSRRPRQPASSVAMTCRFIPWQWCLPREKGRSAAGQPIGISVRSGTSGCSPHARAACSARSSLGARATGGFTASCT